MIDLQPIQRALAAMDASAAHAASGENRPRPDEIFAPEQHAGALDPNTTLVLGARGAGKSFWAGVLGNQETRRAAAQAYPHLGLEQLVVRFGFTGIENDGSISKATIQAQVPEGEERTRGVLLWRCVVLRGLLEASETQTERLTIKRMMERYADPEEWEQECSLADAALMRSGKRVLIIFDALDALAEKWGRLRDLTDALLEVAWGIRGYRSVRAKLFLRPDQMRDLGLRFVELPKLMAGSTNLRWTGTNLYGMLFTRLSTVKDLDAKKTFNLLLQDVGINAATAFTRRGSRWSLVANRFRQAQIFRRLAGQYMGRGNKKGRTYDWPLNHLSDGHGEVTPRSFLTLMIVAARTSSPPPGQALTAEGIRNGLREASKVRLDQLVLEFPWIKRVLAPLARLQVPSSEEAIVVRWEESGTIGAVMKRANLGEFLPPFDPQAEGSDEGKLIARLVTIGVLALRNDGRFDMPDLFRVAAQLLRKGGVAPG
jgi:hypothetical protein